MRFGRFKKYSLSVFILLSCSFVVIAAQGSARSGSGFTGITLEEALRRLQIQGLNILYSSDLVHPEMKVEQEPVGESPRNILDELVFPHGLRISGGPADTLLVIRDTGRRAKESQSASLRRGRRTSEHVVVPFVTIYLTAQDKQNRFVTDLKAEDLVIREDGKEQQIVEFTNFATIRKNGAKDPFRIPLTVCFLIDSSQSMAMQHDGMKRYDLIKQAALTLLPEFHPDDQMMVMGFNDKSWVISQMTNDPDTIRSQLHGDENLQGKTAVFDALLDAVAQMQEMPGRKIIVLCSDGEDNSSESTLEHVVQMLKSSDVTVLALGTTARNAVSEKGRAALEQISDVTGGCSFFPSALSELNTLMADVRSAMHSQYAAGYIPPNPAIHKWRQVRIECKIPRVKLRYRKTYLF